MRQVAQLLLMCDRQDIGISIGSGNEGDMPDLTRTGEPVTLSDEPRIFIYDNYPGGIGFSEPLFAMDDELRRRTRELIAGCECQNGCPTCVGPIGNTGPLAKTVALRILDLIGAAASGVAGMSSIADRLRGIVRPWRVQRATGRGGSKNQDPPYGDSLERRPGPVDPASSAADILDGEWRQAGPHRFLVVDRSYAPGHRHGSISVADGLPPDEGWSRLACLPERRAVETCCSSISRRPGLPAARAAMRSSSAAAGSAGAVFTCGSSASSFASERALLEAVGEVAGTVDAVVTYNGKSFDLPLIETRYA